MLTFGSLFAGIGGMDLGLERAGMSCAWQVEIDPYATRVLEKHWPGVQRYSDVRDCGRHNLASVDLIAGGFPCQDISNAAEGGKGRLGLDGSRSGLWSEFYRIICELRPRYVLVENVSAILVRGLDRVLGDLAACGYDAEWDCLPASAFGAPHQRERFFLIAYPRKVRRNDGARDNPQNGICRNSFWQLTQNLKSGPQWKRWLNEVSKNLDGEISARDFFGVDDGISEDVGEIETYGNAVVPQVAEWIGRRIIASLTVPHINGQQV